MKIISAPFPSAICFGFFLLLTSSQADAQSVGIQNLKKEVIHESSGFTKVIDSKIDRTDTGVIRRLIELSDHSAFLKNALSQTIYIMDLDHFRDGMADFSVFGKDVKVLTKSELIDLAVPFYLTIDGYNKKENDCSAVVTLHSNGRPEQISSAKTVILEKMANTWTKQN